MTVVEPSATAVTTPPEDTVPILVSEEPHVTAAPEIALPPASVTVAVSIAVSPIDMKASEVALKPMVDGTWLTVVTAVALPEPETAVMVAAPSATAVTRPVDETVATPLSDEDHSTSAPGRPTPPMVTVAVS